MATIDLSYLEEITGGDNEMILEMLDLFISDMPEHLNKIRVHAESKDVEELGKEAHKMKPTTQYVGLTEMYGLVSKLEKFGRDGNFDDSIPKLVLELDSLVNVAVPLLEEKREELS